MNILYNTKSGGIKDHFRWVKVPGITPYWYVTLYQNEKYKNKLVIGTSRIFFFFKFDIHLTINLKCQKQLLPLDIINQWCHTYIYEM